MSTNSPLTDEHLAEMNANLERLDDLDRELKLAKQAGIDVTEQEKTSREHRSQIIRLKSTYFPGQR